MSKSDTNVIS